MSTDRLSLVAAVESVATAVRKLSVASSANLGSDCYVHAYIGKHLLYDTYGIDTTLCAGHAAWRIGEGDGDVINHVLTNKTPINQDSRALPYHVWLECTYEGVPYIIDLTTYQFTVKARHLDAMDGGHTSVTWAPLFLVIPVSEVSQYSDVRDLHSGLSFYHVVSGLDKFLEKGFSPDASDLAMANLLLRNKNIQLVGLHSAANLV